MRAGKKDTPAARLVSARGRSGGEMPEKTSECNCDELSSLRVSRKFLRHTRTTRTIGGMLATTAAHGGNLRNGTRWNSKYLQQSFAFLLHEGIRTFVIIAASFISPARLAGSNGPRAWKHADGSTRGAAASDEILPSALHPPLPLSLLLSLISARLNVSPGTRIPRLRASTNRRGGTSNCINRWPESIKHTQIKCRTHLPRAESD